MSAPTSAPTNNPLLLEVREASQPYQPDGQAVNLRRFPTMEAGVIAAVRAIRGAIVEGIDTPGRLCSAWSGRCGVSSYGFTSYVAMRTQFPSVKRLDPSEPSHLALMVRAMSEWLSGEQLDPVLVARCVEVVVLHRA